MGTSYLHSLRVADLKELAETASCHIPSDRRKKDDMIPVLDDFLRANSSKLSTVASLQDYYKSSGSPVKQETSQEAKEAAKARRTARKTIGPTVKNEDGEEVEAPATAPKRRATTTPKAQRDASKVPLPSSPAAVAALVEHQSERIQRSARRLYLRSPIPEYVSTTQQGLSSTTAIELMTLSVEAIALLADRIPLRHAFTYPVPLASTFGLKTPRAASFPDFFSLLTSAFWAPVSLWLLTSIFIPAITASFINFTSKSKRSARALDPVVFNVTRALLTWVVIIQGFELFGLTNNTSIVRLENAIWGGPTAMLVGAGISALAGFYESMLRLRSH